MTASVNVSSPKSARPAPFAALPFLLDGATGTNLMRAGMPAGVCVEEWVLAHPDGIRTLQRAYAESGSDAVMAPTFGANRQNLAEHGLKDRVSEYNRALVALTREAVGERVLVAGDMAPTGLFIQPYGDASFGDLLAVFREQAFALRDAGADYIALETFMSLTEARAALLAAKETGLPVSATFTLSDGGRTLSGGDPFACLATLAAMGADAVGLNCSTGPDIILTALNGLAPHIPVPLIAKPNAGLPRDGVYSLSPDDFAAYAQKFLAAGVGVLGGCCGSTPETVRALRVAADAGGLRIFPKDRTLYAANERRAFAVEPAALRLSPEIQCDDGLTDALLDFDTERYDAALLRSDTVEAAEEFGLCGVTAEFPLAFISADAAALEMALQLYQGRALLAPCLDERTRRALAERYGAILL